MLKEIERESENKKWGSGRRERERGKKKSESLHTAEYKSMLTGIKLEVSKQL